MEEDLIDLVKSNYFSMDDKVNQKQLVNIINNKCSKDISLSLTKILKEIDSTLTSNYVKGMDSQHLITEQKCNALLADIDLTINQIEAIQDDGNKAVLNCDDIVKSIKEKHDEIHALELRYQAMEKQEYIMAIISNIQSALILEDIQLASEQMSEFIDNVHTFNRDNVDIDDIRNQLHKYHRTIEDQLVLLFEQCMADVRWPFISNGLVRTTSQLDTERLEMVSERFSEHFRYLYLIELPEGLENVGDNARKSIINTGFMTDHGGMRLVPVCLPVQLLVRPLVQYFRYFFWTESKVNKIAKPEWYMSQVIQWISIHQSALDHMFPASLLDYIDIKLEFIRALVIVVMEKVHKDLDLTRNNDELFFHLIEESLTMTMDLRKEFDYPEMYPNLIDVICNADDYFDHWMALEQRFAMKQLDEIFRSPDLWRPLSTKCKRVECLESFIGLIVSMKERIECVSDVARQARFCQVLLEVLENYRLRLVQISKNDNADQKRCYDVMNIVFCVKTFLRGWRLDRMFIEVHQYNEPARQHQDRLQDEKSDPSLTSTGNISSHTLSTSNSSIYTNRIRHIESRQLENDSLFSSILSLYQHVLDGLETACVNLKFDELSVCADPYIKRSWLSSDPCDAPTLMNLSPSASGLLLVLRDLLHELHNALEPELFDSVWQHLAHRLGRFLFKEVILSHRFTVAGALQLDFDVRKNLLPLFIPYTKTPERFFVDCIEACVLLTLKWGTAVLTKELLAASLHSNDVQHSSSSDSSKTECPLRALNELGIFSLSPDMAEYIINLRIDPNLK